MRVPRELPMRGLMSPGLGPEVAAAVVVVVIIAAGGAAEEEDMVRGVVKDLLREIDVKGRG